MVVLAWLLTSMCNAQSQQGIIIPTTNERNTMCTYFSQMFHQKPKEVRFGIKREGTKLFFEINDKQWFTQLFKQSNDGIAIDVVSKSRYACQENVTPQQIKGLVLKPVYAKELKSKLKPYKGNFRVYVGQIPQPLAKDELEFNIAFLSNKVLCQYYTIYNLQSYPWDLLDMGVYLDTVVYKTKSISTQNTSSVKKYKTLQFTIPFKKNKSTYLPEDVKPMYDSLRLTDFTIKKISIKAYASVEGSEERNKELQEQRGNSIAAALQSFQKPHIDTQITSSENWVEFLNDIQKTIYEDFSDLSKKEIKSKLTGKIATELEPYLEKHRKAVVTLELDKIDTYKDLSVTQLVNLFNEKIKKDAIEEALKLQNSILEKMKEEFSPELLAKMEIPRQKKYLSLLVKNSIINYVIDARQALIVTQELEDLKKLDPTHKKIHYNLAVLKFIIWRANAKPIKTEVFKKELINLKKYGIEASLIDRMLVNFYIVKAEKEMQQRNYPAKDVAVSYILKNYTKFSLTNYDYLSLAQFLTYYANMKEAVKLLDSKARSVTIDEDLLFYYLNLTIVSNEYTATADYRTSMLNAINLNKNRFCKLFNSSLEGGVTFQLLENTYLRTTYCENCTK